MKKTDISKLHKIRSELSRISQNLPNSLTKELFSSELFLCKSEKIDDYCAEILNNLINISSMRAQSAQSQWLSERVEQQIQAFIQASMRNHKVTQRAGSSDTKKRSNADKEISLPELHQELATHHSYERRLEENLRDAQEQNNQQLIIQCQQRLLRCQRAIAAIEKKIESN